jgi:hypothetical protein
MAERTLAYGCRPLLRRPLLKFAAKHALDDDLLTLAASLPIVSPASFLARPEVGQSSE